MTPFQPLSGCGSGTALDVLKTQADYTETCEGKQQEGSQQDHDKDPRLQRVRRGRCLSRVGSCWGNELQEGRKLGVEAFFWRTWRAGKSYSSTENLGRVFSSQSRLA